MINNGPTRVINQVGTSVIYLDATPDGNFNNPDTFRDGLPGRTSRIRLQFVLDTVKGAFTTTLVQTIPASDAFLLGNHHFLLGKVGQTYRTTYVGHVTTSEAPAAHLFSAPWCPSALVTEREATGTQ